MSDGSGLPAADSSAPAPGTGGVPRAGGATVKPARRPWRLPVDVEPDRPDHTVVRRLVLGSALMLFLELALIRWLGSNIVHLSYFSNFVLLGSFLGIGLGFLISRRRWSILPAAPVILAVLVVTTLVFPVSIQRQGSDVIYFTAMKVSGPPAWLA